MTEEQKEELSRISGLYVGQLNEDELQIFAAAVVAGYAIRSYEAPGGFFGLAKVRLAEAEGRS